MLKSEAEMAEHPPEEITPYNDPSLTCARDNCKWKCFNINFGELSDFSINIGERSSTSRGR